MERILRLSIVLLGSHSDSWSSLLSETTGIQIHFETESENIKKEISLVTSTVLLEFIYGQIQSTKRQARADIFME